MCGVTLKKTKTDRKRKKKKEQRGKQGKKRESQREKMWPGVEGEKNDINAF